MGTVNNVIQVKKTDFEVFDALMVDSQKCSDMSGECRHAIFSSALLDPVVCSAASYYCSPLTVPLLLSLIT